MKSDSSVIRGRYLEDILDQPRALRATWDVLSDSSAFERIRTLLGSRKFERLVLTGMGSSYFASHPLAIECAEHGWTPILLETSELLHYYPHLLKPSTLVIAVSQSGRSAETVRLLEGNAGGHAVVAVTNTPDSPLATKADVAVLTKAGEEFSVSCKTYVSSLMALEVVSAALCGKSTDDRLQELQVAADAVEQYLREWEKHVADLCEALQPIKDIFLVGRGSSLAAVYTGALTIKESDHFHAEGMSSAAFRHGPFEMLRPELFVAVIAGEQRTRALNERMAAEIREAGAHGVLISTDSNDAACRIPTVPECVRPIVEILPAEMMTIALAALAGREAGKFERATKITAVE
ncbi:Glutamine-fructose-6-phosphate transaminase (isomerizing) [Candidatus Koribacter versatilis Ellin345]|uniref:Glutamine--fructose-6-phosphate aminotransferase [isomerizing] n=1 Tax=Koribacter versatilis (strain Ellin345) TaxID=204669 RepID=Q1IVU1_KORVE|nr:SIS domain-containing protein [Candidatus Koribacter versatilis]ABF39009.1 Glutamine-fructose-6-phosphate transaminase (isomerizing) [Candidatus Koribacter versatilis Ellin345]